MFWLYTRPRKTRPRNAVDLRRAGRTVRRRSTKTHYDRLFSGNSLLIASSICTARARSRTQRACGRIELLSPTTGSSSSSTALLGKDWRDQNYKDDAARNQSDFRHKARFQKNMVARDFEDLTVVADALRYLFRKTSFAKENGIETDETAGRRLGVEEIPKKYYELADRWKEQVGFRKNTTSSRTAGRSR